MDALREADMIKGSEGRLDLEPIMAKASPAPLPDLIACLNMVNADLQTAATHHGQTLRPEAQPPAAQETGTDNAGSALAGQEPSSPSKWAASPAPVRKTLLVSALASGASVLVGIAGYFWQEPQGAGKSGLDRPAQATPRVAPPLPVRAVTAPAPALASDAPDNPPQVAPPAETRNAIKGARPGTGARQAPEPPPNPIRLTPSHAGPNPILERAYAALQDQDFGGARQDYDKVLQTDPKNVDALLGLAVIAGRAGEAKQAEMLYLQALEADPRHPVALAGLMAIRGRAAPLQSEASLKAILADQPETGHANFALGNLYAQQGRWSEAQAAYFKALTSDSDNPDYLFNLAVSLDHLHQIKVAAQHYRLAIRAADSRSAAFDPELGRRRLQELQP